ncbi:MAG: hypothetical protein Q4G08_11550 [Capnocytophaga sp.]|nr:hypothetical protein [Capnocytophaga sp.]
MNRLQLDSTGGFPFDTDTLEFMQKSYGLFNALGELAGNLAIIKGCTTTGTSVSDGIVFIKGELLPFKGGTASANVIVKEERKSLPFEDGQNKDVEIVRYAVFGVGSESFAWADFKRINPLRELQRAVVPKGMISMWSGELSAVPVGWQLCDGTNGTPDMRDKFVLGWQHEQAQIGSIGGSHTKKLTIGQLPKHNFTGTTSSAGGHTHSVSSITSSDDRDSHYLGKGINTSDRELSTGRRSDIFEVSTAGTHSHSFSTGYIGEGKDINIMPRYIELAYIMFMG